MGLRATKLFINTSIKPKSSPLNSWLIGDDQPSTRIQSVACGLNPWVKPNWKEGKGMAHISPIQIWSKRAHFDANPWPFVANQTRSKLYYDLGPRMNSNWASLSQVKKDKVELTSILALLAVFSLCCRLVEHDTPLAFFINCADEGGGFDSPN